MKRATAQSDPAGAKTFVIRDGKQMRALRAASRQEILDTLAPMGTVSIPELAAALGRPADSLYYHFRILQKVGLIRGAGVRESNGRKERLFHAVAPDLKLAYVPGPKGNAKAVTAIVGSMLRLTSRDFTEAFQNEKTAVEGAHRELWAARTTGWLTKSQIAELNRRITEMLHETISSSPQGGEQLFALTVVLTPLQRSGADRDA